MPSRFLAVCLFPLLCAWASAQASFVLPAGYENRTGNRADEYLAAHDGGPQQPAHVQFLYNVGDIPVAAAVLQGMDLRRNGQYRTQAGALTLTVDLSMGPRDAFSASTTFADNLGPQVQRVFHGNLILPGETVGPQPAPWSVPVPFSTPFPFVAAGSAALVVDVHVSAFNPGLAQESWYFDAAGPVFGSRANNGPTPGSTGCRFHTGSANTSLSSVPPAVGGVWWVQYGGLLANAPGLGALGGQGVGGSWAGLPLPIDLGPLGAPGCGWHVDIVVAQPLAADAAGRGRWPTVSIPNEPALVSASFFDHSLWLDPLANALGVVTGWSSRWTMGNAPAPNASAVVRLEDSRPPSATGSLDRGYGVIARFRH